MKVDGTLGEIRGVEATLARTWGVDIIHDGSAKFRRFGEDGLQSAVYRKSFEVYERKGPLIYNRSVVIKFYYDHRRNIGQVMFPTVDLRMLQRRLLGFREALEAITLNGQGSLVTVVTMCDERAHLKFRCPRCRWEWEHFCMRRGNAQEDNNSGQGGG